MKIVKKAKRTWEEEYKVQKAQRTEGHFSNFCKKYGISCHKLDIIESRSLRSKYLKNADGNCPDFLIKKGNESCFVEVKTLTNFTNAKREKEIRSRREALQRKHQSGIILSDTIDFHTELWGPFKTFIQSSSKKFKNVKEKYKYPIMTVLFDCRNRTPLKYHEEIEREEKKSLPAKN